MDIAIQKMANAFASIFEGLIVGMFNISQKLQHRIIKVSHSEVRSFWVDSDDKRWASLLYKSFEQFLQNVTDSNVSYHFQITAFHEGNNLETI